MTKEETKRNGEGAAGESGQAPVKIFCHKCGQKLDVSEMTPFSVAACPVCGTNLIVPKWFDSYLLEEIVGEGGMATVYRALDIALDREVAIKIMNSDMGSGEFLDLFLSEARTAATINHHAVIPIYTCAVFEGKPYIVMEYMNGGSLEKYLENAGGPLPILKTCEWMLDISEGLERAAKHGIIHHDIKPANIMLDSDGNVKIGDFGLAQRMFSGGTASQGMCSSWGSPNYVSPEKARTGDESFPGDIYSLGATFYNLITGILPFNGYENIEELVYVRTEKDPVPPNQARPEIPPAISTLIMKMMHRVPEMRPEYGEIMATLAFFIRQSKSKSAGGRRSSYSRRSVVPSMAANPADAGVQPQIREFTTPASSGESPEQEEKLTAGKLDKLAIVIVGAILAAAIFLLVFLLSKNYFSAKKNSVPGSGAALDVSSSGENVHAAVVRAGKKSRRADGHALS